jgi:hypothetical protein
MEIGDLSAAMFGAAKSSAGKDFQHVQDYLQAETTKLAETLIMILELSAAGKTSDRKIKMMLNQQKKVSESVLIATAGMAENAARAALDSALSSVKDFVNSKLPISLL